MGEVERGAGWLTIHSHFIFYGNEADEALAHRLATETSEAWNAPKASIDLRGHTMLVRFTITAAVQKDLSDIAVLTNTNPRNNFFRVEKFARTNISFVDDIPSNTGYLLLENLYPGSTTMAHEYGHTLGLHHPKQLDIRGKGQPGIMYPRGTLTDPVYQYDAARPAGTDGGTLHPKNRVVTETDIRNLKLEKLVFTKNYAVLGQFTSIWHPDHAGTASGSF